MEKQERILVIEDEEVLRETIQWMLEEEGWIVETATNGREALRLVERSRPSLVILDISLPLVSGDSVAVEVQRRYNGSIPILVITADGRAETKARRVGAFDYLSKPFDLDALIAAVQQGLSRAS